MSDCQGQDGEYLKWGDMIFQDKGEWLAGRMVECNEDNVYYKVPLLSSTYFKSGNLFSAKNWNIYRETAPLRVVLTLDISDAEVELDDENNQNQDVYVIK